MKHLFTLCFACFSTLSLLAQREADLNVTIGMPESPAITIAPMQSITLGVFIDNFGPDGIEMADTLAYYTLIDGDTVPTGIGGQNHFNYAQNLVPSGDSLVLTRMIAFDSTFEGSTIELCVFVKPKNANNPIADPDLSNNTGCITITIDDAAGIGELAADAVTIAPNPASGQFTIASQLPVTAVQAADASGKVLSVATTDTQTIDCSIWSPGTYFLTVETTGGTVVKRMVVR